MDVQKGAAVVFDAPLDWGFADLAGSVAADPVPSTTAYEFLDTAELERARPVAQLACRTGFAAARFVDATDRMAEGLRRVLDTGDLLAWLDDAATQLSGADAYRTGQVREYVRREVTVLVADLWAHWDILSRKRRRVWGFPNGRRSHGWGLIELLNGPPAVVRRLEGRPAPRSQIPRMDLVRAGGRAS
ncbi:MAG: hypothetical protein ACK5O2_04255 [Microthrixaceae bacterium]